MSHDGTGNAPTLKTPCKNWDICENIGFFCQQCNQAYERQGLKIFADTSIANFFKKIPGKIGINEQQSKNNHRRAGSSHREKRR